MDENERMCYVIIGKKQTKKKAKEITIIHFLNGSA
jgi:mannitol-specific phosphotransferase system IIBC component